ncbi:hypothetical protein PAMP_003866 [Pampus punctatissimus]
MAQQLNNGQGTTLIPPQKAVLEPRSSMTSASFNFINSIIGSGIIGLPYALNQAGLPFGLLLLIVVAFITAMISYNITTGDTLTKVFQRIPGVGPDHILAERHFVILLSTLLFTLPLSLYRNIGKLGKVSFLSMMLTLTILIIVIIRAATFGPQILPSENAWAFAKWNAVQAVGVMSFAFICHHNSFLIYVSLEQPTLTNWSRVTHISVVSNVICSRDLSKAEHVAITLLIVAVCTSISLAYDCLGVVLELNGTLSATPLIFIIPSACFLKLSTGRWFQNENLIPSILIILGLFVMVTGLTMTGLYHQDCSHGVEMFYCADANISSTVPSI